MMKQTLIISMCLVYVVVAASYFDVVQALYGSCDDIEKDFKFEKALREKCNKNLDEANKKVEEGEGIKRQLGDCKNDGNRLKIDIDKLKKDKEYAKGEAQEFEDMLIREQTECRRKDKRCKECEEQLQQSQNKLTECEDKLIECGGIESAQSKRHAEFLKGQINDIKKQRDSLEVELDDLKTTFRNIRLTETICQSNYTDLVRQLSECRNKEGSIVDNIGIQMEGGKEFMSGLPIQVILAVSAGAVFIIIFLIHGNNKNQSLEFKLRESEKDLEREKELKEQEIKSRQLEKEHFDETITKLTQGRILGRHPSERSHSPSPAPTVKSTPRQTVNQTRYGRDPDQNADRQVDHDSYGRDLSMLSADDEEEDEGRTSGYRKKRGEEKTSENVKPPTGLPKGETLGELEVVPAVGSAVDLDPLVLNKMRECIRNEVAKEVGMVRNDFAGALKDVAMLKTRFEQIEKNDIEMKDRYDVLKSEMENRLKEIEHKMELTFHKLETSGKGKSAGDQNIDKKMSALLSSGLDSAGKHSKGNGASLTRIGDSHLNTNKVFGGNNRNMEEQTHVTSSSDKQGGGAVYNVAKNDQSEETPGPGQPIPSSKEVPDPKPDDPDVGFAETPLTPTFGPSSVSKDSSMTGEPDQVHHSKLKVMGLEINSDGSAEKGKASETSENVDSMADGDDESTGEGLPGEEDNNGAAGDVVNELGDSASTGGDDGKLDEGLVDVAKKDTPKKEKPDGEESTD